VACDERNKEGSIQNMERHTIKRVSQSLSWKSQLRKTLLLQKSTNTTWFKFKCLSLIHQTTILLINSDKEMLKMSHVIPDISQGGFNPSTRLQVQHVGDFSIHMGRIILSRRNYWRDANSKNWKSNPHWNSWGILYISSGLISSLILTVRYSIKIQNTNPNQHFRVEISNACDSPPLAPLPFSTGDTFPVLTAWPLAPFCSAVVRPLWVAYRSDVVLLEMVAVVGLVELELPPADERMRRAPSGLSGVFTRSFAAPANK
jgi:hypothetical protein